MDGFVASLAAIAAALFVTELTDKDALLILALSTKMRARRVFFAGAVAFILSTGVIVTLGSLLVAVVPIFWIRLAGGIGMIGYGIWEARGLVGQKAVEEEESKLMGASRGIRAFLTIVISLILLDLAGDATEVLTIVLVAQYSDPLLVFFGCCLGLVAATGVETALGNRLGRILTPKRIRFVSVVIFILLGASIILLNSA